MKKHPRIALVLAFLLVTIIPRADTFAVQPDDILGKWISFKDGKHHGTIEIYKAEKDTYEGKIVWGEEEKRLDAKNPDPSLRSRLLIGAVILQNFTYSGNNDW